ncbi:2OG-Fe(II) oxygenase [Leptospira alstonii]|uniref:2OG-Fe(II) oxygenase n=1 Tax=Leptospira alstonii TaxID=28452 RepID=UPI0007746D7F|nr:2OG-Fe(II) oxygenase [Leptospira alstonii]
MNIINKKYYSLLKYRNSFLEKMPFPYIVLDDFLDSEYFDKLSKLFNSGPSESISGKNFNTEVESKKWISLNSEIPELIANVIQELNSEAWLKNIHELSGIPNLFSTKNDNTQLANFHEMKQGGFLGSHVDHSHEIELGFPHVVNIILYLSPKWDSKYGGATLFFDKKGKSIEAKVEFLPNRAVIFLHTPYSFHGVENISETTQIKRRTLYVDYYSASYEPYNSIKLNFSNHWFKHGTTFVFGSFSNYLKTKNRPYLKAMIQYRINKFLANCRLTSY